MLHSHLISSHPLPSIQRNQNKNKTGKRTSLTHNAATPFLCTIQKFNEFTWRRIKEFTFTVHIYYFYSLLLSQLQLFLPLTSYFSLTDSLPHYHSQLSATERTKLPLNSVPSTHRSSVIRIQHCGGVVIKFCNQPSKSFITFLDYYCQAKANFHFFVTFCPPSLSTH